MAWLCGVNGLVVRGESSAIVIVHRTPPDQIASAIRSDFERHPIGFRTPPDQISNAIRLGFERHPIGFRTLSANSCSSFMRGNITFYTT